MNKRSKIIAIVIGVLVVIIPLAVIFGSQAFLERGKSIIEENPERARINLRIASVLNPTRGESYAFLAKSYHIDIDIRELVDLGESEEVVENYKKALNRDYNEDWIYVNLGHIHNRLEEYEKAYDYFSKAINIEESAEAYYGLANYYMGIEDFGKALSSLHRSIEIKPTPEAYIAKTSPLIILTGNLGVAIRANLDALDLDSQNSKAIFNLSQFYAYRNNNELAIQYLEKLKNLNSEKYDKKINRLESLIYE